MKNNKLYNLISCALGASIIAILGPLTIPIGPVPLSLCSLAIMLIAGVTGAKNGTISTLIYIALGVIGLPIFSSFRAGLGTLTGPTGGYIIGYIILAVIAGFAFRRNISRPLCVVILVLANTALYSLGTVWLCIYMDYTCMQGLLTGVIPFIAGDIVKIVIAFFTVPAIKRRIQTR